MRFSRRLLRSDFVLNLGASLIAAYIRLVQASLRWQIVGAANRDRLFANKTAFIFAFWHGRLLMMPPAWPKGQPFRMLISRHRDGEIIARTVGHFGISTVRGSTSREGRSDKGGASALRELVRAVRQGESIGVTPDGPRGPRMRVSDGLVAIARATGVPLVPVTYAASGASTLGSWDRFQLPRPFGRGVFIWGEPFNIPRDAEAEEIERLRAEFERIMIAQSKEADKLMGRAPIEPDEAMSGADHARA